MVFSCPFRSTSFPPPFSALCPWSLILVHCANGYMLSSGCVGQWETTAVSEVWKEGNDCSVCPWLLPAGVGLLSVTAFICLRSHLWVLWSFLILYSSEFWDSFLPVTSSAFGWSCLSFVGKFKVIHIVYFDFLEQWPCLINSLFTKYFSN